MRNTWTELHLETLKSNVRSLQGGLAEPTQLIFVVKANAYGHGVEPVCRAAQECGVRWFAVAHAHEAFELRSYLPEARILVLGVLHPSDVPTAMRERIVPVLTSGRHGAALADAVRRTGGSSGRLRCHVKLDTGMGRLGLPWERAAAIMAETLRRPELDMTGVCTHLAASTGPDPAFSELQIERFHAAVARIREAGFPVLFRHVSNSGGILRHPSADFEGVRAGILLYGYAGGDPNSVARPLATRPCLQWKTRVALVKAVSAGTPVSYDGTHVTRRATRLATINAGYADGFSRLSGGRGFALIRGRRCPVVGRVTMNMTVADVGPDSEAREWDEAVLLGEQGSESLWADEAAAWRQTIAYEVLTDIRTDDRRTV